MLYEVITPEDLRGEARDPLEAHRLALGQGIPDLEGAGIVETDDVAGPGFVDYLAVLAHEGRGVRGSEALSRAHVVIHLVALELAVV